MKTDLWVVEFTNLFIGIGIRGNLEFGGNFLDDRARAASTLVVHRGDFFLGARFGIFFKDDDFNVLPTKLHHGLNLWIEFSTARPTALTSCANLPPI